MNVDALTVASATGASKQDSALSSLTSNFDNFLTLLTQQLQNQDPLSPMDTNEFTTQLVQFTGVEQAILQNKHLEKLVNAETAGQTLTALNFIGREVSAAGDKAVLTEGEAHFAYSLKSDAASATYTIRNEDGDVVFSGSGPTEAGTHEIAWNGVGADGNANPDGVYSIEIKALDGAGEELDAEPGIVGTATGIESRDGVLVVMIGDVPVYLDDITSVRNVTQPATGSTTQPSE